MKAEDVEEMADSLLIDLALTVDGEAGRELRRARARNALTLAQQEARAAALEEAAKAALSVCKIGFFGDCMACEASMRIRALLEGK